MKAMVFDGTFFDLLWIEAVAARKKKGRENREQQDICGRRHRHRHRHGIVGVGISLATRLLYFFLPATGG